MTVKVLIIYFDWCPYFFFSHYFFKSVESIINWCYIRSGWRINKILLYFEWTGNERIQKFKLSLLCNLRIRSNLYQMSGDRKNLFSCLWFRLKGINLNSIAKSIPKTTRGFLFLFVPFFYSNWFLSQKEKTVLQFKCRSFIFSC